ncbi:MAG: protoheme IX farnesyltransferase [Bacteroidota bacterium]|nr:protoheme IX farnesyltransferase [Bacteroidota bacterium]MDP4195078.1 protoheme IX farnesyltransferase [Bacteroidota bacterium]
MKAIALKLLEYDSYNIKRAIGILMELGKVRITFFVAFSTAIGFILASGSISGNIIIPTLGVFILACGSSAMNHYQERKSDALMERTKQRPLPSGAIKPKHALIIVFTFLALGLMLIYVSSNFTAMLLGVLAVLWYNAFYTPLKKVTPLAVVPGALIGAIPPIIGWVAGGGSVFDKEIFAVALFFFIWQIPHFWLLLLIYSRDYESAGFPTLTRLFNMDQLSRITFIWIAALAVSCLLIPLSGVVHNLYINILLLISGLWLLWKSRNLIFKGSERRVYRYAFRDINNYVLFVTVVLALNKIINI